MSVFAGNESDSTTLMPQVEMVRNRFGIKTLVLVGDRGMISQKRIDDDLRNLEGVDWITALKSASIRKLIDGGQLQLGLFDERNLFELTHPDFAGERLFACRKHRIGKTARPQTSVPSAGDCERACKNSNHGAAR